ncbi:MAG TPA: hypothetical protein VIZ18_11910 [Ktedonobacteraceae bacterium]
MQKSSSLPKHMGIGFSLFVMLFLIPILAACGAGSGTTPGSIATASATPKSTATGSANPTGTPEVSLGAQPCPGDTGNLAYWQTIIGPTSGPLQVQSVSCAHMTGNMSFQALVTGHRSNAGPTLDAYVFNNITSATPTKIFQALGLVKGVAKISNYSTVMTAQADELSALNTGKPESAMTADLFREFKWSASTGELVQTVFPGIFPDLTRWQAEGDQASVNAGHQPWKLSSTQVADALAVSLLDWSASSPTTLLSGGGAHDTGAVVRVRNNLPVSGTILVTLSRLEGNTNGGIWEAISVTVDGMSITNPDPLTILSNPISVQGTGSAFEGVVGHVIILDHLYHSLGQANATGVIGMGPTSFSTSLYFQSTFPAGIQEGVLVLSAPSNANGAIAAAVMQKVLINGALESPFAVLSVNLTVSPSRIAGITCGSTLTLTYTATFHVQAGTAGGTIQFLYTWNNGRASPGGSVTVPPNGPSTVTFTYTATGRVGGAYAFPGVAQVNVTSPNQVDSPAVKLTGTCS